MKKISLILGLCLLFFVLQAQTQTFVYSKTGEKVVLEKNDNIRYVHFEKSLIFAALNYSVSYCLGSENLQNLESTNNKLKAQAHLC